MSRETRNDSINCVPNFTLRLPLNIMLISVLAKKITPNEFNLMSVICEFMEGMQVRLFVFNEPFNIMEGFCNL